jgi:hypothetical protein
VIINPTCISGFGSRVSGFGFRVSDYGFRVSGLPPGGAPWAPSHERSALAFLRASRVSGSGSRVRGVGSRDGASARAGQRSDRVSGLRREVGLEGKTRFDYYVVRA